MNPNLSDPILMRLITAMAIIAIGFLLFRLINQVLLNRARLQSQHLKLSSHEKTVLLYFTTPTCAPCKTVQRPAIQKLLELVGDRLEVIEIDAFAQPELANQWGVWSVPTTFIIDPSGKPRHVNHGLTSAEKLLHQFEKIN